MYLGLALQVIVVLRLLPVMPKVFHYPRISSEGSLGGRLYLVYSGIDLRSASAGNGSGAAQPLSIPMVLDPVLTNPSPVVDPSVCYTAVVAVACPVL